MPTSTDAINHGAALTQFLEQEWRALGTNRGKWCRENDLNDSTVLRWGKTSTDIDMNQMQLVADGLGRPLWQILVAARYLDPDEIGAAPVEPRKPVPAADAIRADPALSEDLRQALLKVYDAWMAVADAQARAVSVATGKRRTRGKR